MPRDPIGPVLRRLFELQQVGTGLTNEANSLLNDLFHEIAGEIARLDPTSPPQEASKRKRVEKLVGSVDDLVGRKSEEVGKLLRDRVAHVGAAEAKWAESLLEVTLGGVAVDITRSTVGVNMMKAILDSEPFEGELLEGWVDATSHRIVTRVRREIQLGMVRGETMGDLVRRVRGRSDGQGGFSGGVWEATTRDAESVVRTAVNFISNRGHLATYKQNAGVLKELRFTATLDGLTSDICIALDGRTTDPEDPDPDLVPPRHFRCRSVLIPVVDWEGLGIEPPPEGERASQDGPVSASTDYEQWLKDQPAPFQDEVLGPERAQLFRDGKISLRELIDDDQRVLTIEELRTRSGLPATRVTPGIREFVIDDDLVDLHERSFEWAANLDPEERAAVEAWTGDGFESFRGSAQEPRLLQAVARAPEANRTVWRGVRSDALGFRNREDVLAAWDKRIGEVVKEDVFRSATLDPNGAPSFGDVIFEIEGGGGRYIEGATMKSGEHEVLFFAGSRFEILGVDWNAQVRLHDGRVVPRPVIRLRHLP